MRSGASIYANASVLPDHCKPGVSHEYKRTLGDGSADHEYKRTLGNSVGAKRVMPIDNRVKRVMPTGKRVYDPSKRAFSPFYQGHLMTGYMGAADEDIGKKEERDGDSGGYAGSNCTTYLPKGSGDVKPYLFAINQRNLIDITKGWLNTDEVYGRGLYTWSELAAVNRNRLKSDCSTIQPSAGGLIYIPKDWPPCPKKWEGDRRNPDGTVYVEGEPPAPPGPGPATGEGNDIERVDVTEGEGGGMLLFVLAAAAAVGGGILLYNSKKKKR
jgi:hypothetical protein